MKLKKLLFVTLGSLIMGLGISITIGVNLGSDPMTLFWIGIADNNTFYIAHRTYIKWFRHHSYLPLHLIRQHHYQLYNVLAPVLLLPQFSGYLWG